MPSIPSRAGLGLVKLPHRANSASGPRCRFGLALLLLAATVSGWVLAPVDTAQAQAAAPGSQLPPFRMDPSLPPDIVVNADQGLGQCHWLEVAIVSSPSVSWGYDATETNSAWAAIEPQPGTFSWAPLDAQINKARDLGKRIWLELLTTEGQTPQWARDGGVELVGSRGGTPVPWDEDYQRLLRRAVHAMAARYDEDPTVDAILAMSGGCYGEMAICARETDTPAWEQAGYTDDRFIEAAKQIIDIYLEEEYQWEDGSRTHGFRQTPIVLQLGGGLYGHTVAVIRPVVEYAVSKYGMRVWLKYNGWGGSQDMGWLYQEYNTRTRVGYEPVAPTPELTSNPREYIQAALDYHASYLCLQKTYFGMDQAQWQEARELAARYLGAQVLCQSVEAPVAVVPGEEFSVATHWVNRGTVPLMRPERQGTADIPASYDVLIALVDPASGAVAYQQSFVPAVPTTEWYAAQPVRIQQTIAVPAAVQAGEYDLRVALVNPILPEGDPARYFRLVNASSDDGSGRYTVGRITVQSALATPTVAATPTPTSVSSGGNPVINVLRAIWNWLRNLFR